MGYLHKSVNKIYISKMVSFTANTKRENSQMLLDGSFPKLSRVVYEYLCLLCDVMLEDGGNNICTV